MNSDDVITHAEIRQRAHQLWERAGRPEGQDTEHWLQAENELRAERETASTGGEFDPGRKAIPTAPSSTSAKVSKTAQKGTPVTPASPKDRSPKQENL